MEYELINLNDYTRTVFDLGIPTPEPGRLKEISIAFAGEARKIHTTPADTSRMKPFPS